MRDSNLGRSDRDETSGADCGAGDEASRRAIIKRFGRYAAVTAPAMMVLLQARGVHAQNPGTDPDGPPGGGFSA